MESPDQVSTVRIPPEYADLAQLPHRLGDCVIDLLEDPALPRSHVQSPLTGGDRGYENTCLRIPASGVHSVLYFTRLLKVLFCEEEGGRSAVY